MNLETPPSADLAKLTGILKNARNLINKTEADVIAKNPVNESYEDKEAIFDAYYKTNPTASQSTQELKEYDDDAVQRSNLPAIVKEAMMKNKIPIQSMTSLTSKFSINDVSELIRDNQKSKSGQQQKENTSINKSEIEEMISEMIDKKLMTLFSESYTKKIIQSTMNNLIKEGRLSPKQKTL